LVESLLLLRLVLKFLNANTEAFIVFALYWLTDILVWPYKFIFPNFYWRDYLVDLVAISAMVGYVITFFIALGILKIFFRQH